MKKTALGFVALATALLANLAATAVEIGDIRSIDPCDEYGNVVSPGSIETARTLGEKAYFRIRLENKNSEQIFYDDQTRQNPWRFEYVMGGTVDSIAQQMAINPPKIGVIVSGVFRLATIESCDTALNANWFTDIICSYTVQPGDLAFPMTLANSLGGEAADSITTEYFIGTSRNSPSPWRLVGYEYAPDWSSLVSTNVCRFKFGDYAGISDSTERNRPGNGTQDFTLAKAGLFIQSIDFDDSNPETDDDGNEVWRAVREGSTATKISMPMLSIPGNLASNYEGVVYLWTADTNSVVLADAQYTYGSNRVYKMTIDGSESSLQFRLRGVTKGTTTEIFLSSSPTNIYDGGGGYIITNFVSRTVACIQPPSPGVSVLVGAGDGNRSMTLNATANFTNSTPFRVNLTRSWTNDEDVVVGLRYTVNGTEMVPTNIIALSSDANFGYEDPLPLSVTIPAGETTSTELDTNPNSLYALGALTSTTKGDKVVITPYFENPGMAAYFATNSCILTIYGMNPSIETVDNIALADISSPASDSKLNVRGGVRHDFQVRVSDTYRNMFALDGSNDFFTVTWRYEGGATSTITNDYSGNPLLPDGDGILHVPMTYPVPASDQNMYTTIKVTNADGRSTEQSFYVFVKQPKNVSASVGAVTVGEGSLMPVTFTLSETASSPTLYAYLEPANDTAKELSYAAFFVTNTVDAAVRGYAGVGIPFGSGELEAVSDKLVSGNCLTFFDNSSGHFVYNIRLCSSTNWSEAARITEFAENQLIIDVTNNAPVITQVLAKNNETGLDKLTTATITMSLSDPMRTFRISQLNDVDLDKNGENDRQVVYGWEIYRYDESTKSYPAIPGMVMYKVGLDSTLNMEELFGTSLSKEMCGTYRFVVRAQDKDMRGNRPQYLQEIGGVWSYDPWRGMDTGGAVVPVYPEGDSLNPGNDWGAPYTFEVRIDENPYVDLNAYGSFTSDNDGTPVFSESDLLREETMGFTVSFNDRPTISGFLGIPVEVTVEAVDDYGNAVAADTDVAPQFAPTTFSFTASTYSNRFAFTEFDGTKVGLGMLKKAQRYRAIARVTSTAASPSGTPWNELYTAATNYFRIKNDAPQVVMDPDYIGQNSETNAFNGVHLTPNEAINFNWSVIDVPGDLVYSEHGTSNLIVTCSVVGGQTLGASTNQSYGTFRVWFEKPGYNQIRITATDKDGDTGYSQTVYFYVETSKNLTLYPFGPARASLGNGRSITKYLSTPGLGIGKVWADGNFGSIKVFKHLWNYGTSAGSATAYAQGYAADEVDTSVYGEKSIAPDMDGNGNGAAPAKPFANSAESSWEGGAYHEYDNFFYRWFVKVPGKSSGNSSSGSAGSSSAESAEWTAIAPNPGKIDSTDMDLPTTEVNFAYPETSALAIFSREKYTADNMGDINGDGIPDKYAVGVEYTASTASGEEGATTTSSTSQTLCEIASGGTLAGGGEGAGDSESEPDLMNLAAYNGDGDFFPRAASAVNPLKPAILDWSAGQPFRAIDEIRGLHIGLNEPGVSDYDLSYAEQYALLADCAAAGVELTGTYGENYAAATNWAASTRWTPEAINAGVRLNPAHPDTDGDGFDDGWEYYFWYYAKVGAITNGVWGRLEGRRFSFAAPATGVRIAPEEIARAFDPLVASDISSDFDNDGLTDFEEYVLGTNPCDWDSDGDGMNDLWEVMNGLDPLSPFDGLDNPDRDFMARCDYAGDTFTVFTFANGEIFGLPTKTSPMFEVSRVTAASTNGYLMVAVENGATNSYIVATPVAVGTLTEDVEGCLPAVYSGDVAYLASVTAVTVASGAEVLSVTGEAETFELISAYYKAELAGSGDAVWFAAKPKVFPQSATGFFQLAADTVGFTTMTYGKASYLGEERTFPAGTLLKSVADAAVNINQVYVSPYMGEEGGFSWINPSTREREPTYKALPLFNYGGDGVTLVPCALTVSQYAVAPVAPDREMAEAFGVTLPEGFTRSPIVKVETDRTLTLIHAQVLNQYGFDPRVAWTVDDYGYVDQRWRKADSVDAGSLGATGVATNTVPYTSLDEYLVLQYRQQMRAISKAGLRSATESLLHGGETYLVEDDSLYPSAANITRFFNDTTYPNFPVSFVKAAYQERQEVSPFDNSTNRTIVTYWEWLEQEHDVHGADTDFDGIPDGWELYVNADPNNHDDAKLKDGWADDKDELGLLEEYAGVDSCNAYTNRFLESDPSKMIYPEADTITKHHPGRKSGWWNKFFPTNPYDGDTDGDGVQDHAEGRSWKGTFHVGNNIYGNNDFTFTFIYGRDENADTYDMDGSTVCFRGGGLNPCTVDTDGDLIPDAWEFQFAGVLFKDGQPPEEIKIRDGDLQILTMADGSQAAVKSEGSEIRGGMDGTWGPANGPNIHGDPCLDFDHDGLANWQEYLVQSLRHLRYDDDKTPLMGIDPGSKQFLKFIPFSAWDGEFFHKKCLESGFTGLGSWKFRKLGYFTRPPHEWDMLAQNTAGLNNCVNYEDYEGKGYRVMLPPIAELPLIGDRVVYHNGCMWYASTDPRRWDSDEDGMDDYYELFHGLNPLLGSVANPAGSDDYGWGNLRFDVIGSIYGTPNAWCNYWTGWNYEEPPAFDALRYPWMIGTMECDADGDGLRNDEESLKVNLAQPNSTHTDPTPLWMTDSTSVDHASFTSQYYGFDPYITEASNYDPLYSAPDVLHFPWEYFSVALRGRGVAGESYTWMFSFEENEGYDTDHDFKRDAVELTGLPTNDTTKVELASDPQNFSDPNRRQALYLPGLVNGVGSAVASRDGQFRRAVNSEPDLFKTFTVECWVKPDGDARNAVLVERICNYGASTLSNSTSVLRANFRLGVDADGRAYGEFEGSTPNSGSVRVESPTVLASDAWTHIAFTFDGSTASLYLNGDVAPVATALNVGLIPANGIMGIQQEYYSPALEYGYVSLPCMTMLGATALNGTAILLGEETSWSDFGSFYKGWIDEVRVWDGARTPTEIHANYMKRFSMDDIKTMRSNDEQTGIFDQWASGVRRSSTTGLTLPAELIQHYNFVTLPGGVEPQNVLTEPPEFQENVFDNVRKPNSRALDNSLLAGWWSKTPVHSTVYWNYAIIPWIGNTVAHLPYLDGSAPDSQYWSTGLAGVMPATSQGFTSYSFPNEANPYPYFFYHRERHNRLTMLGAVESQASSDSDSISTNSASATISADSFAAKWSFQLRSDFLGTSDLVPLGGAFAKRGTDFWDGQGAMDAWAETAQDGELADANGNGIPDWAEQIGLTTADAYLRALAEGLLPDGSYSDAYKSLSDINHDGVKDWWQNLYGLSGSAQEDTDKDGLADFAEYLVSEVFKFGEISPILPKSNGQEFDYFRKAGELYLGELFSDHDFMEDHLERDWAEIGADPAAYDAHRDSDEDGWSNWAEVRSKQAMGYEINATGIVKTNTVYDTFTYYDWYKNRLDELLSDTSGEHILLDTDFTFVGYGYWYDYSWYNEFYGSGYIKYSKLTPVYASTYVYKDHPIPGIEMTVRYKGASDLAGRSLTVQAYSDENLTQPDATFSVVNGDNSNVNVLILQHPESGYLREGKNTFVVSVGASSNVTASASSIMGVVRNVDVGWSKVEFEVELTDESPICSRPSINVASNSTSQVYVYRYAVDGFTPPRALEYGPILTKSIGSRTYLHEGDFLSDADFDIDWANFRSDVLGSGLVGDSGLSVTSVTYRVYSKPVDVVAEAILSSNATPYAEFSRNFGATRATAVPVAPGEDSTVVYGAKPTFRWRMTGDMPDSYTAFAIQVKDAAGAVVWNSGTQMAPARNAAGEYQWTAPLYPGDQTSLGKVFADTNNYTWAVTMYNAKYQTASWSATRAFRVNVYDESEVNNAGYYGLNVAVKYFGPSGLIDTSASTLAGTLRVEAFSSPDFSGVPAGRTFVRDLGSVTNAEHEINATITGLDAGTYYVRAFIDSDGDFSRSVWESWGYACPRGDTTTGAIYAPAAFTVGEGFATPKAMVYVEDCDTDQDCLPDIWEYREAGANKTDFLLKKGPMTDANNGYIAVNPDLQAAISDLINGGSSLHLLSAAPGRMSSTVAALALGVSTVEPSIDADTLAIKSLTLKDGVVTIELGADADDPAAGTVFVTDGVVKTTVVVRYADSLGGEWRSVEKSIEKKIEDGAVSEELSFSLSELGLDSSKGFFKVEVK